MLSNCPGDENVIPFFHSVSFLGEIGRHFSQVDASPWAGYVYPARAEVRKYSVKSQDIVCHSAYLFKVEGRPFFNHLAATNVTGFSETLSLGKISLSLAKKSLSLEKNP